MKKVSILFTVLVAFTFLLVSWKKANNLYGAIHINDFGCGALDGNGNFTGAIGDAVITPSGNGNLKCKASGVANSTGHAVKWDNANTGLLCGTFNGLTDDWSDVVSASGQLTLQCHNHPAQP